MKTNHKTKHFSFGLIAMATAMLAGCGGGGEDPTLTPTPTTPSIYQPIALQTAMPAGNYTDPMRLAAFNYLNTERLKCGFGALTQNTTLDKAAQNHAEYVTSRSS